MKKIILVTIALICSTLAAQAQNTATQTVNINMTDVISATFTATGTATGSTATMTFDDVTDYANGVTSSAYQLKVMSTRNFNVTVKTSAANFTYTGAANPAPTMPTSMLKAKVSANATGGAIAGTFASYTSLSNTAQNMITNGDNGSNQTFSVQYQGTPGFTYPAGTYATTVVYTVTQQ